MAFNIFKKDEKIDYPLIIILLIVLCILVIGLLVVAKQMQPDTSTADDRFIQQTAQTQTANTVTTQIIDPTSLIAQYRSGMTTARESVAAAESVDSALTQAEEVLVTIRVPQPYLDAHLEALITIRGIATDTEAQPDQARRAAIISAFDVVIDQLPPITQ